MGAVVNHRPRWPDADGVFKESSFSLLAHVAVSSKIEIVQRGTG
jgi:hypothetical protein